MLQQLTAPCDFAKKRYLDILRWRNLWTALLWFTGLVIVLFCIAAILIFARSSWLPGAITTIGALVNGVAMTWVVNQRSKAVAEEIEAFGDLKTHCGGAGVGFIGIRQQPWFHELQSAAWKSLFF